jgi:hypothetical protein
VEAGAAAAFGPAFWPPMMLLMLSLLDMKAKKVIRVWNPVQKLKSTKGGIVVSKGLRGNGKWAEKTVCHFFAQILKFCRANLFSQTGGD